MKGLYSHKNVTGQHFEVAHYMQAMTDSAFPYIHPRFVISLYYFQES